jgi:hypothetical protein
MQFQKILVLIVLAISACGKPTPPEKQYLSCYVRHDAATLNTKAEATLREGEVKKSEMEIKGGIRYQRAEMRLVPIQGMSYRYEYRAEYLPSHLYEWKNTADETLSFTASMNDLKDFSFEPLPLSRNKPAKLRWQGKALEQGETLVLIWENLKTGETVPLQVYTSFDTKEIEFPAAKMHDLSAGKWSVYVVRKKMTKTQIAHVEATGVAEYYSKPDTLQVTE